MAVNLINDITIGDVKIYVVDSDPSLGAGFTANVGDVIIVNNGTGFYIKSAAGNTNWSKTITAANLADITSVGTITTGIWNGTAIADAYIASASIWNAKQNALSGTGFVKSTAGVISYDTSTYLTGNQTITLSGDVTGSGTTSITTSITDTIINNKLLTGYTLGSAAMLAATDSIKGAFSKLQAQINATVSGVSSVFTRTGAVVALSGDYNTSQVTENTNLYYTNARVNTQVSTYSGDVTLTGSVLSIGSSKVTNTMLAGNIDLTTKVTGILPITNGGTNTSTIGSAGSIVYSNGVLHSFTLVGTTGQVLTSSGAGTPTWTTPTTGTVTNVSVLSANGFAATVSTSTTTPTITISTTVTGLIKGNGTIISAAIAGTDYQSPITLTTTGNNGASTFTTNTLNVPTYTLSGLGGQPLATNLTSLSSLSFVSTSFVKMSSAGTFVLDTNTYLTGNQTITLSGDVTGSGTTSISTSISNTTVTGKLLTGYVSGAGTVAATDSILQAIQKLNGNVSALVTGVSSVNGSTGAVVVTTTGTINRITVTGGSSITQTVDIAATYVGQSSITTLGTITTGVWNGTAIANANLANSTVTIGTTSISLGGTSLTLAGLTSVTSTTFIGALTGNASTATILQTARTINGVSFNGSANITVTSAAGTLTGATLNSTVVSSSLTSVGTITTGVWNGTAIANANLANSTVTIGTTSISLGSTSTILAGLTSVTSTNFIGDLTGNSSTATTLQTARTISGISFDGSSNITLLTSGITEDTNLYFTNARSIGSVLTGYVSGSGNVVATDTVLQAIQKINGNVSLLTGAMIYQGTWNANTNTPTFVSGIGTKGYLYKVSVAGSTTIDGISQWNVGDSIVFDGNTWDKIDGVASEVVSVNGLVGSVALTGTTNRITVSASNIFDIAATYVGQSSITTLGIITTGVWNGTAISNANLANSSVTIGSTSISLGSTSTTLIGLTSVTSTTFIGALTGNASTATTLQTARTINSVSFDGSTNITITASAGTLTGATLNATVVSSSLTSVGTITTGVWNGTAISNANLANSSVIIGSTAVTLGNTVTTFIGLISVTSTTFVGALTGNASTSTTLQTARTINGVSFDGSANITVTSAAGTLTGTILNATVVSSSLTSVGTITTGVWNGTAISNANLANSTVTIGTTSISLGGTSLTLAGLTSVTSTTFIGNASTATILQTARTINGVSFDGSVNITVTAAAGTLTGTTLNSTVVSSSLTSVGTISSGFWNGAAIIDTYISSATNWNTAYTNRITSLTTAGNSGAATLVSNVLNIPTHTLSGLGGQPLATNLTSLSGLTFVSTSFVKMSSAGTFVLDTNTYLTGNQTITLSGDVTGSGTTSISTSISNTTVTGKLLTGYVSGAGTVAATDSILQAIQKLNGNIGAFVSSVTGTTNRITSTGGNTPIIDIAATYVGQTSITTLGTVATGIWNGTSITTTFTDAKIKGSIGATSGLIPFGTGTADTVTTNTNFNWDNVNSILKTSRLNISGSVIFPIVQKTANYSITNLDYTIECTSGTFTVTLPTAVGITGTVYVVKKSSTGTITVATTSSQTIDGGLTATIIRQYDSLTFQSNGANWIII